MCVSWGVVGQFFHTNFSYKYILVSGVNFGGAFGGNINKKKNQNGTRYPPHYILESPLSWPLKICTSLSHN